MAPHSVVSGPRKHSGKIFKFQICWKACEVALVSMHRLRCRVVASGGLVVPDPHLKSVPTHFMFGLRLLHTSNIVFKKCGPPCAFWTPLLRNPGDGPVALDKVYLHTNNSFCVYHFVIFLCFTIKLKGPPAANPPLGTCLDKLCEIWCPGVCCLEKYVCRNELVSTAK